MTGWEQPLIVPDLIEDDIIDLLKRRHPEHLAKLERQLELEPETIERFATIDRLAGEGFRLREDRPPAILLGIFGTADIPERTKRDTVDIAWTLAAQIITVGSGRADTLKRRNWMAMTVVECLLSRLPRKCDPVSQIYVTDIDLVNGADDRTQRTVAEAQLMFTVGCRGAISTTVLPLDDSGYIAGEPGGPPEPTYGTPVPWGTVGTADIDVEKLEPVE